MTDDEYLARLAQLRPKSGRRPEELNQSRNVNIPAQLARGWAAGTLGLPGDIEGLGRSLLNFSFGRGGVKVDPTTALPGSDYFLERLPGRDEAPAARAAGALGSLFGGVGAPQAAKGAGKVAGALADAALAGPPAGSMAAQRGVLRVPGGNWLDKSIEKRTKELKAFDEYGAISPEQRAEIIEKLKAADSTSRLFAEYAAKPFPETDAALNNWIDKKLNKYIRNDMATPGDPLRAQAEEFASKKLEMLEAKNQQIAKAEADLERAQAERGVAPEMLTRSQARLRELRKERDYIEQQTGLHSVPDESWHRSNAKFHREEMGSPIEGLATTPVGRAWEAASDAVIIPDTASTFLRAWSDKAIDTEQPWLRNVSPDTRVFDLRDRATRDLGFDHLIDELKNAMDPDSGLPKQLLLKPKDLEKMSVAQAAKHVDEINAWRSVQEAEVNAARAANAATVEYRPYQTIPGTDKPNEKGLRWVELKIPETAKTLPEGWELMTEKAGLVRAKNAEGDVVLGNDSADLIKNIYYRHPDTPGNPNKILEDTLAYEGEMLQHCVGGYCPDVASGRSRIFSLRDAEGKPHVTVEVVPSRTNTIRSMREGTATDFDIKQIKGLRNAKPADEYLPFVQDFVREGNWAKVDDLKNTGLMRVGDRYITEAEFKPLQASIEKFLHEHPAFEAQRKAEQDMRNFSGNIPSPEYSALDRLRGADVAPGVNYTWNELRAIVNDPGAYEADTVAEVFKAIEKLRKLYPEAPTSVEDRMMQGFYRGYAEGGTVQAAPTQRGVTPLEEVMRDRLLRGLLPAPFAEGGTAKQH
jgi:hypothetical protein